MTRQIAVRLSDQLVEFIDREVRQGRAPSRAAVVTSALELKLGRLIADRDTAILAGVPSDPDLDELARYAASIQFDELA